MSPYGGVSETSHVISNRRGLFYSRAGVSDIWTANEDQAEQYPDKSDAYAMCNLLQQEGHDCFVL